MIQLRNEKEKGILSIDWLAKKQDEKNECLIQKLEIINYFLFAGRTYLCKYYSQIELALKEGKVFKMLIANANADFCDNTTGIESFFDFIQ